MEKKTATTKIVRKYDHLIELAAELLKKSGSTESVEELLYGTKDPELNAQIILRLQRQYDRLHAVEIANAKAVNDARIQAELDRRRAAEEQAEAKRVQDKKSLLASLDEDLGISNDPQAAAQITAAVRDKRMDEWVIQFLNGEVNLVVHTDDSGAPMNTCGAHPTAPCCGGQAPAPVLSIERGVIYRLCEEVEKAFVRATKRGVKSKWLRVNRSLAVAEQIRQGQLRYARDLNWFGRYSANNPAEEDIPVPVRDSNGKLNCGIPAAVCCNHDQSAVGVFVAKGIDGKNFAVGVCSQANAAIREVGRQTRHKLAYVHADEASANDAILEAEEYQAAFRRLVEKCREFGTWSIDPDEYPVDTHNKEGEQVCCLPFCGCNKNRVPEKAGYMVSKEIGVLMVCGRAGAALIQALKSLEEEGVEADHLKWFRDPRKAAEMLRELRAEKPAVSTKPATMASKAEREAARLADQAKLDAQRARKKAAREAAVALLTANCPSLTRAEDVAHKVVKQGWDDDEAIMDATEAVKKAFWRSAVGRASSDRDGLYQPDPENEGQAVLVAPLDGETGMLVRVYAECSGVLATDVESAVRDAVVAKYATEATEAKTQRDACAAAAAKPGYGEQKAAPPKQKQENGRGSRKGRNGHDNGRRK